MSFADRRETIARYVYWLQTRSRRYAFALVAATAAGLVQYGLNVALGFTQPFILFYPTIILIVLLTGWGPGLLATFSIGGDCHILLPGAAELVRGQKSARHRRGGVVWVGGGRY
jgi:hypothetical protein